MSLLNRKKFLLTAGMMISVPLLLEKGEYKISEVGKKPVAKVLLKQTTKAPDELAIAIQNRRTDRSAYYGEFLSDQELNKILKTSGQRFTEQRLLNRKE